MTSPVPAEWAPHRAMWVGFPSHAELWEDDLAPAQGEVAALVRTLAGPGRERVKLLARGAEVEAARRLLGGVDGVEIVSGDFGDVWLRDTAPIFFTPDDAAAFRFNGWGGKYVLKGDETVPEQIRRHSGATLVQHGFVLEGGALDHDGAGTVLTTRQCLLNPNRNPGWTESAAEAALAESLGARRVVWLGDGLAEDHTDGHVDNLARFVAPGVVACPEPSGEDDPNAGAYADCARRLVDAGFRIAPIPSPGRIVEEGEIVPASHMNFLIANGAVIMPTYEDRHAPRAAAALQAQFPDREVIALPAKALLTGGGSFHCITQQVPA